MHTIEQDHVNSNLLFAGTEFGCFFSLDGGEEWVQVYSLLTWHRPDLTVVCLSRWRTPHPALTLHYRGNPLKLYSFKIE